VGQGSAAAPGFGTRFVFMFWRLGFGSERRTGLIPGWCLVLNVSGVGGVGRGSRGTWLVFVDTGLGLRVRLVLIVWGLGCGFQD